MIPGVSGSLLSHAAIRQAFEGNLRSLADGAGALAAHRELRPTFEAALAELGPSASARSVYDRVAAPMAERFGFRTVVSGGSGAVLRAELEGHGRIAAVMVATAWGLDPSSAWRDAVRHGIGAGTRWCLCVTGPALRIVDAARTYTRRFVEFDVAALVDGEETFAVLWALLRADAFPRGGAPLLDRAVGLSERYRGEIRTSLQQGVRDALRSLVGAFTRSQRRSPRASRVAGAHQAAFDESLIVVYRVLFLLFAEARGLVPRWHPTYRHGYTIESLLPLVEGSVPPCGIWESLQAIARLAHRGCRAGALNVPPFNGRLFSPAQAPLADAVRLDDRAVQAALLALTTRAGRGGRERISYADLGVEQLGGVYESVLDYEPVEHSAPAAPVLVRSGRRKATGTFYTPRSLTEFVVRRTLSPLVDGASSTAILALRVLDPAMGSGAFLVAACRYLAAAYETALLREGCLTPSELGPETRAGFRRVIAQRCLFGVDINPMAVQLGRLSLWLATLSRHKPLTFLDHHLRVGNSLAGASLEDVARRPPPSGRRAVRPVALPLFPWELTDPALAATVAPRLSLAVDPGDTIDQVRDKEQLLASLSGPRAPLGAWKAIADLWCAAWFGDPAARHSTAAFASMIDHLLGRAGSLPAHLADPLIQRLRETAGRERFFHWPLEFPEIFYGADGRGLDVPGFDAAIGNPPWEMLRADAGNPRARADAERWSSQLTTFSRASGVYRLQGDGHANLYHLFVERTLALVRQGGRLGLVLPSGFACDHGCAALRRGVFDRLAIDTFVTVENRDAVFPIHRGLRFLLLGGTTGGRTSTVPARTGIACAALLDDQPDSGRDPEAVEITRALIDRVSGAQCAVPDVRCRTDLALLTRIAFAIPALGDPEGWRVRFGRELNATDDRPHFVPSAERRRTDLPVVEGKQVRPFRVDLAASRHHLSAAAAARLLRGRQRYSVERLAYRDVASATNRLTLIAAVIPAGVVTTHTLFCLKTPVPTAVQHFLCGVFNSYVANYLIRMRVGTHVGAGIVDRLPVPRLDAEDPLFVGIATLSERLAGLEGDRKTATLLQARVAHLYGLSGAEFAHVLSTFPLVEAAEREEARRSFETAVTI